MADGWRRRSGVGPGRLFRRRLRSDIEVGAADHLDKDGDDYSETIGVQRPRARQP